MSAVRYVGMGLWFAKKTGELNQVWDLYQATQSTDAALSVATKLSEIAAGLAAGYAVTGIIEIIQKTGLDRVFDSIRKESSYENYLKSNKPLGKAKWTVWTRSSNNGPTPPA